jgi:hypothetical protein
MIYEPGHPYTTLSDWHTFAKEFSPHVIEEVIDRGQVRLPDCFVPLARGVAIAGEPLLRKAGHHSGKYRPRGWRKTHCDVFEHDIGWDNNGRSQWLVVRQCSNQGLWTIERWRASRPYAQMDELLVHQFGSTPIMTRSYQSAMRLAVHCNESWLPAGLRWVYTSPPNCDMAIEIARKRRIDEALSP